MLRVFFAALALFILTESCKPVQRTYLPRRKKAKCHCPSYTRAQEFEKPEAHIYTLFKG